MKLTKGKISKLYTKCLLDISIFLERKSKHSYRSSHS